MTTSKKRNRRFNKRRERRVLNRVLDAVKNGAHSILRRRFYGCGLDRGCYRERDKDNNGQE